MAEAIVADPLVSVVVPDFSEQGLLPEVRQGLTASLAEIAAGHEIVLVDDGSTDRSAELIVAWAASAGRTGGRGASYPALLRLAFEAIVSLSDVPLKLATHAGMLIAAASVLASFAILGLTLAGTLAMNIGLWILIAVLFLGGVQPISIGIGRYLARVHEQTLERPLYLVSRVVNLPAGLQWARSAGGTHGKREAWVLPGR
jgi:glycosyltransferase involved in cell wall biosynthesis